MTFHLVRLLLFILQYVMFLCSYDSIFFFLCREKYSIFCPSVAYYVFILCLFLSFFCVCFYLYEVIECNNFSVSVFHLTMNMFNFSLLFLFIFKQFLFLSLFSSSHWFSCFCYFKTQTVCILRKFLLVRIIILILYIG